MLYLPFRDDLWIHFFIGVGFCYFAYMWANEHGHSRKMFLFGGDTFSLGERKMWVKWYVFALAFEFMTSLLFFRARDFYNEMAYSPLQAGFMTLGMFLVDRFLMFWDTSPSPGELGIDVDAIKSTVKKHTEKVKDIFSGSKTKAKEAEKRQAEDERFQNLTRGH